MKVSSHADMQLLFSVCVERFGGMVLLVKIVSFLAVMPQMLLLILCRDCCLLFSSVLLKKSCGSNCFES